MRSRQRSVYGVALLLAVLLLAACAQAEPKGFAKLYKSPTCGCCEGYAAAMRAEGYAVDVIPSDMDVVHEQFMIPMNMRSCHMVEIDGYVVEGHVPLEAVGRVLEEKPAIRGIALPDMPAGTPGMPGVKQGPYTIFALTENDTGVYGII